LQARILRAYGLIQELEAKIPKPEVHGSQAPGTTQHESQLGDSSSHLWDRIGRMTVFPLLVRQSALLRTLVYNRPFLKFRRRPARILEVGFGNGLLLFALSHLDTELFGTEISEHACKAVSSSLGVEAFCGQLWDAGYADGQFDLVIFSHSLEHLSDPMRALREARRIVAPDGGLIISLPNPECLSARVFGEHWAGYDFPRHIFLFGPCALAKLAEKACFRLQKARFPLEGSVHHFAESVNSRLGLRVIPNALSGMLLGQILYLPIIAFRSGDVVTFYLRPR